MNQVACYNEMNQDDTDTLSDSNSESNESMAQDDDDSSLVNLDLDNDEEVMDGDFEDEEDDYEEEEKVTPSADPSTLTVLFSPITKSLFPNRDATIHFVYDGQMRTSF